MITPLDPHYLHTKQIILGNEKIKPDWVPPAERMDKTFEVTTINITYDANNNASPRLPNPKNISTLTYSTCQYRISG